ncbi:hypothetical protein [Streptomyces sp. NPDC055056]
MTRDWLTGMLGEQTTACGPARDALLAGGTFTVWDGLLPAERLAHIYQTRLRIAEKRTQPTMALSATVRHLLQAAEEPLRIGRIDAPDMSWTFIIFLNASASAVLACTGIARTAEPAAEPDTEAK